MVWQDYLITVSIIGFAISLIPQAYYGFKEKKGFITLNTSIPTFIGLCAISFAYLSLSLFFSAIVSMLTALVWLVLVIQRIVYAHG
ncbi:hypothetical protein HYX12_01960 [Candidatus Woesearchaeota archaeon]|nr:hypothetical protein [Candidatus Woesearchaeota archaeon]